MTRGRGRGKLMRKDFSRNPLERVLIVCEGAKTEPQYLQELKAVHRIGPAVVIIGAGAGPSAVLQEAVDRLRRDGDFDQIFCVFDRDTHEDFAAVIAAIEQAKESRKIRGVRLRATKVQAVASLPCFEYWLLLQFGFTDADLSAAEVLARLRQCEGMGNYAKSARGLFAQLAPLLENAKRNADCARQALERNSSTSPATDIDRLVDYLSAHTPQKPSAVA